MAPDNTPIARRPPRTRRRPGLAALLPPLLTAVALLALASHGRPGSAADTAAPGPDPDKAGQEIRQAGVARADITPATPILLTGYSNRREETDEVMAPLFARALAIEAANGTVSLVITADLLGFTADIRQELTERLGASAFIAPQHIALCATHTHTGPKLTGLAAGIYHGPPTDTQRRHIDDYTNQLVDTLEQLALDAIGNLQPATLEWAVGSAGFAVNRRRIEDGRWTGWGAFRNEHVDHDLPLMVVRGEGGKPLALWLGYACHCTTLTGDHTFLHGDWAGEAAARLEQAHDGATVLVSIGCGADANPEPRGAVGHVEQHAQTIADEVNRLLDGPLSPLPHAPSASMRHVALPFEPVTREQLEARLDQPHYRYSASLFLEALDRGEPLPEHVDYPVQLWRFGDQLAMFFLAGEVVADYSIRMKGEGDRSRLWLHAYANESPGYVASQRIIHEGGYEVDESMAFYLQPNRFQPVVEHLLMETMRDMLPREFLRDWSHAAPAELLGDNDPQPVTAGDDGTLTLPAEAGTPYGPRIEFMPEPEWRAFGWWTDLDYVAWDIEIAADAGGMFEVELTWSVADNYAGRPFLIEAGDQRLRGYAASTGEWENFETSVIGNLMIEPGPQRLTVKPSSQFEGPGLMDVRRLRLIPATQPPADPTP